jgi:hypothetical protein
MKLSILAVGVVCLGLAFGGVSGCDDEDSNGTGGTGGGGRGGSGGSTGGTGGATGGTGGTGGATGGAGGSTGGTGGGGVDAAASVKYADVQPIFMAKCAPCHTTGTGTKFPLNYADANKTVLTGGAECGTTAKVGACTIVRIKSGSMPYQKMCKPEAGQPPDPSLCVTAAEQAKIQAWVDAGLPM